MERLPRAAGCEREKGGQGSRERWSCKDKPTLIVPRGLKSRHTANAIPKDAGVKDRLQPDSLRCASTIAAIDSNRAPTSGLSPGSIVAPKPGWSCRR